MKSSKNKIDYDSDSIEKKWPARRSAPLGKQEYNPSVIEKHWQSIWERKKIFTPDLKSAKNPYYTLMMFPYPSAEGLHVGNMYAFTGADVHGRFKRMQGKDVFEPIGLDGFGIHSENYALKVGKHPREQAKISEKNFYRQLHATGNGYDWTRTIETYDPEYYRWTQWLFIQMFKKGLAYRKKAQVNWCPSDKTVLADEQVIDGKCERDGAIVEKKDLEQWFFKITEYADRLLYGLSQIDWPEKIKIAQRQWIGRSEGARIKFKVQSEKLKVKEVEVFTTRPDTLFGATFLVISPEHPLIKEIGNSADVKEYIKLAKSKSTQDRADDTKEKTGVFSGLHAVNPVNNEQIPVWIADYVLMEYGTGAIMAVPAHDQRDFEFAKKYGLSIRPVIIKQSNISKSYLMGGDKIADEDLRSLGVKIVGQGKAGRYIEIPFDSLFSYEELIKQKLQNGFWNEYVGLNGAIFIFKFKDGSLKRLTLNDETEIEIDRLGAEFNNQKTPEVTNVWGWLSENEFYKDILIHDEPGHMVASKHWDDYAVPEAMPKILDYIEQKGIGKREVTYHLRDWLISRQRYWGPPIPMIHCSNCEKNGRGEREDMPGWWTVPEKDLPVLLPDVEDWRPEGSGTSPLANHPEFYETKCPSCGNSARRETDVSDTFLDSSWYYLRYLSVGNKKYDTKKLENNTEDRSYLMPYDIDIVKKWCPAAIYIGGAEHSVLHLLYVRFVAMVLHDLKISKLRDPSTRSSRSGRNVNALALPFREPFPRFFAHGLIVNSGAKMSKSRGNIVVPDKYIEKFGADTVRLYLMFLGQFSEGGDFRDSGIEGMHRFVRRVWTLLTKSKISNLKSQISNERVRMMHKTIKKVTQDLEALRYNTAIAAMMEWYNFLSEELKTQNSKLRTEEVEVFLKFLAPFAPHATEELWQKIFTDKKADSHGNQQESVRNQWRSIHLAPWPTWDKKYLVQDQVVIPIQINGKRRGEIVVGSEKLEVRSWIEEKAREAVQNHLEGKEVRKVVYVPGKIINFVV